MSYLDRMTKMEAHEIITRAAKHRKNVEEIMKGKEKYKNWRTLDNSEPKSLNMSHVKNRLAKRRQEEMFRRREIQRENIRLMDRMAQILREDAKTTKEVNKKTFKYKSHREKIRRMNKLAIKQENKHIRRRLTATKPVYSCDEWKKEYQKAEEQMRNLSVHEKSKQKYSSSIVLPPKQLKNHSIIDSAIERHNTKIDSPRPPQRANDGLLEYGASPRTERIKLGVAKTTDGLLDESSIHEQCSVGEYNLLQNQFTESLDSRAAHDELAKSMLEALQDHETTEDWIEKQKQKTLEKGKFPEHTVYKTAMSIAGQQMMVRAAWFRNRKEVELRLFNVDRQTSKLVVMTPMQVKGIMKLISKKRKRSTISHILRTCIQHLRMSDTEEIYLSTAATTTPTSKGKKKGGKKKEKIVIPLKVIERVDVIQKRVNSKSAATYASKKLAQAEEEEIMDHLSNLHINLQRMKPVSISVRWEKEKRFLTVIATDPTGEEIEYSVPIGLTKAHDQLGQEIEVDAILHCFHGYIKDQQNEED